MSAGIHSDRVVAEDAGVVGSNLGPQGGGAGGASRRPSGGSGQESIGSLASDIAGSAAERGKDLLESAKGQAVSFADQRKDSAAQSIANIASSLRDSGRGFEEQPNLQTFVSSAADGLDQLASGLKERSFSELFGDIETYARRQPVATAAVAAVAGFLLARFIKSSAEDMAESNAQNRRAASGASPASRRA